MLRLNHSLTVLDMSDNPIIEDAVGAYSLGLLSDGCTCKLRCLSLDIPPKLLTAAGLSDAPVKLNVHEALTELRPEGLPSPALRLLAGLLRFNTTITVLDLSQVRDESWRAYPQP